MKGEAEFDSEDQAHVYVMIPHAPRARRVPRALVLFPGALGDLICFLPALAGLIRHHGGRFTLVIKPEWQELLAFPDASIVSIDRAEIADLFTADRPVRAETSALLGDHDVAYSWTGASEPVFATRLATIVSGPVHVHPFRAMRPGEHAVDYYARCAGVEPAPFREFLRCDSDWLAALRRRHDLKGRRLLVVHAGSGSPSKNWSGFAALAADWRRQAGEWATVVCLQGPAEADPSPAGEIAGAVCLRDLTLPQVAALLNACDLYAGNDSGISHLAGAVGARGVVLFGSTDPATWAPRGGGLRILQGGEECGVCGPNRFCTHRLGVGTVATALARLA